MKTDEKKYFSIVLRYLILLLIALPGMSIFYYLFLPLTKYPIYFFVNFFYEHTFLMNNILFIGKKSIELVEACIAGSAYYFLLILNLSTAKIEIKKRLKLLAFTFGLFLLINILRIGILTVMFVNDSSLFDITHKLFWYLGSTVFVVLIWFLGVKIFRINEIPFYDDLKYMYKKSLFNRKNSKRRKINN